MQDSLLNSPPLDTISRVAFHSKSQLLLVSSWDKSISFYENETLKRREYLSAPILDAIWSDVSEECYATCLDGKIYALNTRDSKISLIATRTQPQRALCLYGQKLFQGGWDQKVYVTDLTTGKDVFQISLPGKVFSMTMTRGKLVVAMSSRQVYIYDVRNLNHTLQKRESSLKFTTRMVQGMPDGQGYVCSSIEGRIGVEYFDPSPEAQSKKYAYRCHRKGDEVYPIHALAFSPLGTTFASGGGDGVVNIWDMKAKKRIKTWTNYPTGISSLAFSPDGTRLAIACSYSHELGEIEHASDQIYIKNLVPSDYQPK